MSKQLQAWTAGLIAHTAGRSANTNPYVYVNAEFEREWDEGYMAAELVARA